MTALRPDVVLVINDVFGRGKGSGVDVTARGAQLWRFRDGLVEEVSIHQDREAALARDRRNRLRAARLYFVCDGLPGGQPPGDLLDAALRGGVDIVQLREKSPRCAEELVSLSEPFRRAADAHGALFILNDRPDLVEACGADGVHVGQDDTPVAEAREAAPAGSLVGLSTHSPDQLDAAVGAEGAARPDQVSVGPVWETPTKEGRPAAGLEYVRYAAGQAGALPWFAIGGIDQGNAAEVAAAGATRAVVVRAIRDAADPESAARELRAAFEAGG
jgi:thiamine-phosphate pyrophosphorylase